MADRGSPVADPGFSRADRGSFVADPGFSAADPGFLGPRSDFVVFFGWEPTGPGGLAASPLLCAALVFDTTAHVQRCGWPARRS